MVDEKVKGFNPLKKGEWDCVCLCVDRLIDLLRERERESQRGEREKITWLREIQGVQEKFSFFTIHCKRPSKLST